MLRLHYITQSSAELIYYYISPVKQINVAGSSGPKGMELLDKE